MSSQEQFIEEIMRDPDRLAERFWEVFGPELMAKQLYIHELIIRESGYGGIEIVYVGNCPQNIKAVVSYR